MTDGTFEQKLDAVMDILYHAYLKSLTTNNLMDAFLYKDAFIGYLREKFGDKNINVGIFIDKLERDEKVWHTKFEGNGSDKYKLTPQGVDFINRGDSYVKLKEVEKLKIDLEFNLLASQNKANESTIKTNQNTIITNQHTRQSNVRLIWIFAITALLSLSTAIVAILTYRLEITKYERERQEKQQKKDLEAKPSSTPPQRVGKDSSKTRE